MEQINGFSSTMDVSRLFAELVTANEIVQTEDSVPNNVKYKMLK